MKILVPAKLNLRLSCIGKTTNNYHILNMVNCKISLYDEIDINRAPENEIEFSIAEFNNMENNICLKILNDLSSIYGIKTKYHIYIKKNIPSGAGLGGGSCDAAALINFLDMDNNLNLSIKEKESFGLKYGADIPYCLHDDMCFVKGIGEEVISFDEKLEEDFILIYPNIFLSTKDVYKNNHIYTKEDDYYFLKECLHNKNYNALLKNDLDASSNFLSKDLENLRNDLENYGKVFMTGSGSTLLLIPFNNCLNELKDKYPDYIIEKVTILN